MFDVGVEEISPVKGEIWKVSRRRRGRSEMLAKLFPAKKSVLGEGATGEEGRLGEKEKPYISFCNAR